MIYAFDIDGTITFEVEGHDYENRTPRVNRIRRIQELYKHNRVTLFSSRWEIDREITVKWLADNKVPYHDLILEKPLYDVFVDDKSEDPRRYFSKRNYNFHRSCWRYEHGNVDENEIHPCFFCGHSIALTTPECKECGIMVCAECNHCLCTISDSEYETLVTIHSLYCCHLDQFTGKIKMPLPAHQGIVRQCEKTLQNCYNLEFNK